LATVTTIATVKAALIDEIQNLAIASATAAAPAEVQVSYGRPPADQVRSEGIFWDDEMRTVTDAEYRLQAGRRTRFYTWQLELVCHSQIITDTEDAELRCMAIAAAVETYLAANAQPAEWATTAVASGALTVLVTGFEVEQTENAEGFKAVEARLLIDVLERLV